MTPTATELMAHIGYGQRPTVELPNQGAHRLTPTNRILTEDMPILRRLRPLVREASPKGGVQVYDVSVGCLDVLPPEAIYQSIVADNRHAEKYPQAYGEQVLLDALAEYLANMTGLPIEPEHSCIVPGGLGAVDAALELCTEVGGLVTVIGPSWPNTPVRAMQLGRKVKRAYTSPEDAWRLPSTSDLKKQVPKETALLVIERPGNPTGANWLDEELQTIGDLLLDPERRHMTVFADEEYYELCAGRPRSVLELGLSRTVSGQGFSKNVALTSARIGRMTSTDRRIMNLLVPYCNVRLGSNNFMNLQHALARLLNDFGPNGLAAYFWHLNRRISECREIVREVMGDYGPLQLIPGTGAYYDVLVASDRRIDAAQVLMLRLVRSINESRMRDNGGPKPFTYAIPLSGFYGKDAQDPLDGFRLTLGIAGEKLRQAMLTLRSMVDDYISAGYPNLGTIEEVIGKVKSGQVVETSRFSVVRAG